MREFFGWVCILLVFGGVIVAVVGAVVGKFSSMFGARDSTSLKWVLITLIGVAMIACGLIWIHIIPSSSRPSPQETESEAN
jgi:hypothetical protein